MKKPKVDNSGAAAAAKAQAEAQAISNNLRTNFQTDLKNENVTAVDAGGGAAQALDTTGGKRKRQGQGLSSTLGINV